MSESELLVDVDGYVATLTINRPEKRNALNPEIHAGLVKHIDRFADEGEVRCLIIKGQGDLAFSAGDDLTRRPGQAEPEIDPDKPPEMQWPIRRSRHAIFDAPFPVIAMIQGYCVGGGLALASECDMRISADTGKLGIPPSKLGIIYEYDRIQTFIDLVGPSFAKELFCTGRTIDAQRALRMGLVNDVVPVEELHDTVYGLADELAINAPMSVRGHKHVVNTLVRSRIHGAELTAEDIAAMLEAQDAARQSEDANEGRVAFREKRKPVFKGR